MYIEVHELDHVAGLLAEARMEPLKKRIQRLESENERLRTALSSKDKECRSLMNQLQKLARGDVHNHFEAGSSAQVFNETVNGTF